MNLSFGSWIDYRYSIYRAQDQLVSNCGEQIRKLEELKPHNLWQKMRNLNQNESVRTEQDLDRLRRAFMY
ncbi:hypothetical protein MHI01_30925 [Paenibacillus sp. FSL M7-0656]|uniref:hypothetical protein n=1 Tax=Paenibacillus sp. FSL M7-0656 TaxID=2921534 RepID=UPI0030F523C3